MSPGHRTQGHSRVLFQSKNIDPRDITRGHSRTCPEHDICVSYLKKNRAYPKRTYPSKFYGVCSLRCNSKDIWQTFGVIINN
jgi:hypothetical protein